MTELVKDITTGDWVIFAPGRSNRPDRFDPGRLPEKVLPEHDPDCLFCSGNESLTPPETSAIRKSGAPNSSGWSLRVFPNAFPAIKDAHEIIVESPSHSVPFFLQGEAETENVVRAYIERFLEFAKDSRNKTICIFRNHGKNAGASLAHPHSQIIAAHVESPEIIKRRRIASDFLSKNGKCPMCTVLEESKSSGLGIYENDEFAAICPPASKYPYEIWIVPKNHQSSILEILQAGVRLFAGVLSVALSKMHAALENPDFNMVVHSVPGNGERDFHWFVQIVPRISEIAGFEIGTGIYINTVKPDDAAEKLRKAGRPIPLRLSRRPAHRACE